MRSHQRQSRLTVAWLICTLTAASAGCGAPPVTSVAPPAPTSAAAHEPASAPPMPETVRIDPQPGEVSELAQKIIAAEDRSEEDRKVDARRHPAELLTFLDVQPGMKVADLGAGGGYTTELLARVVGKKGVVWGQNNAHTLEKFHPDDWSARIALPVNAKIVRVDREYDEPLPEVAKDLDLVTILFSYHDVIAQGHDTAKMNAAVFQALKPGGFYVIADHTARTGSGLEAAKDVHRIDEALVREQVLAAGFRFAEAAQFLRDPEDKLGKKSFAIGFETDRFLLKFYKPHPE